VLEAAELFLQASPPVSPDSRREQVLRAYHEAFANWLGGRAETADLYSRARIEHYRTLTAPGGPERRPSP
jgi:hypothetical protein